MTNGLAQALQGNFAALTRVGFVLDADTKKKISNGTESQRAAAIVEVLNSTYKGFNETLAKTPEGQMIKLKQEFDDLKQTLGEALLPILVEVMGFMNSTVMPVLKKGADFVKKLTEGFGGGGGLSESVNKTKDAVVAFFKPFVELIKKVAGPDSLSERFQALVQNIKAFVVPIFNALVSAFGKVRKAILDNQDRIVNLLTIFKELFNWANKYLVPLFKTVLVFAIQTAAKGISAAIKLIIPVVEFVASSIKTLMNVAIKGINFLLKGYNKVAKALGKDQIELLDEVGKKTDDFSVKMGRVGNVAVATGKKVKDAFSVGDVFAGSKDPSGGGGKGGDKNQKKIDALKAKIKDYYKDWKDLQTEANEKAQDAQAAYDERVLDAYATFADRKKDLQERYDEQMQEAQDRYNETKAELEKRRDKTIEEARTRHGKAILEINAEYRKREEELAKTRDNKILDLERAAQRKREDIVAAGTDKLRDIIQKSRDKLRDAWAKGTEFKLEDLFGMAKDKGGSIVDALKNQLEAVKKLQAGAGELAGQGFSQNFIEQIVQAGPEAGMKMIEEVKKLSPEQQKDVQNMYAQLDTLNQSGMDTIANTLSTSTNLATTELTAMYQQTQQDIAQALAEVDANLKVSIADAKADYETALSEAAKLRDEKLAEADAALLEAIKEAKLAFDEALAEADVALKKAQEQAKKTLDKGLKDAQEALDKALEDAQKAFEKRIDEINKSMQKKLDDLIEKIKAAQAAIAALGGTSPNVTFPSYTPFSTIPTQPVIPTTSSTTTTVNVTGVNLTDANSTAASIINYIKFGNVLVPSAPSTLAQGESGAIGAASISSGTKGIPAWATGTARSRGFD